MSGAEGGEDHGVEVVGEEGPVGCAVLDELPGDDSDDPAVNLITFTEVDGRTTLEVLVQCPSREVRDIIIDSGMEVGMREAYDKLEQVAISLA